MAKIAIDADGVLANFIKAFCQEASRIWPGRIDPNYVQQTWDSIGDLTAKEIDVVWKRIDETPNWWMTLPAYGENVGALAVFFHTHRGHDVYIVTSRRQGLGSTVAFQTDMWLRACGVFPGPNYLGVLAVDHSDNKQHIYKRAEFDFSVDDKGSTVVECDHLPNHKAFLLDRPYNQDAKVLHRIKSLDQYFKAVV